MEGCLAELVIGFISRGLLTGFVFLIDRQIVQRRDLVVRLGRRAQDIFHLPEWMCVFTAEDPGMSYNNIRMSASLLGFSYLWVPFAFFLLMPMKGTIWDPWVLGLGVVNPACFSFFTWLTLIFLKGRQDRQSGPGGLEVDLLHLWSY